MIVDIKNLDFVIDEPEELDFVIDDPETLDFELDAYVNIAPTIEPYQGPYEVIPKFEEQRLETKRKAMNEDVIVHEIPLEKVTNPGGGYTVTIGG